MCLGVRMTNKMTKLKGTYRSLCDGKKTSMSFAFLLSLLLLLSSFLLAFPAQAVDMPDGEVIERKGFTNATNGCWLRSAPYLVDSNRITTIAQGSSVEVYRKVTGDVSSGSRDWYFLRDVRGDRWGYIHASLVTLTNNPIQSGETPTDSDFESYLTSQGFPESYKPYLRQLHADYPQWVFEAFHVSDMSSTSSPKKPLAFDVAVDEESKPGRNMVNSAARRSHRSYEKGDYNYETDTWKIYDAGGWMGASREIVAYSLDPRNFLSEQQVFQFEKLTYHPQVHNIESIQAAIKGSFMDGKTVTFTENGEEKTMTYPDIFMDAAVKTNVNPFFLAQRCLTEVGKNGSDSVSGTVSGYEGYYNFYNIGATAGTSPIINGLKYARYGSSGSGPTAAEKTNYLLPWDNPWRAIVGGAFWIGKGYINPGQDTSYLQKFNIDGDTYGTYWHQYMGNVYAPSIEAGRVYSMYNSQNLLDSAYVFRIPVMTKMPKSPAPYPTDDKSRNNWLKSIKVEEGTLSPKFHAETYEYTLTLDNASDRLTIQATPHHAKCTVTNTGSVQLSSGENKIIIEAISESGHKRPYTLTVTAGETVSPKDGYVIKGDYLTNAWPSDGRNEAGKILKALDIPTGYSAKIYDAKGKEAPSNTLLGTGSKIEVLDENDESFKTMYLVIYGDITGDGKINTNDLSVVIDRMSRDRALTDVQLLATDVTRDGKINTNDLSRIIGWMSKDVPIPQD